jgi:hypothetical protein
MIRRATPGTFAMVPVSAVGAPLGEVGGEQGAGGAEGRLAE